MKKIAFSLCVLSFSLFANAQKDSAQQIKIDTLKKQAPDTIRIGNMIIVSDKNIVTDKNKTGSYEIGHGLVKINLNGNDKGYRKATRVAIREKSDNNNPGLYVKSFKDTLISVNDDTVKIGSYHIIKSQKGDTKKNWGDIIEDGDFDNTHITIERTPKKLKNINTNWWIFDLGFANLQDNTNNKTAPIGNLPNSSYLKLNNVKSSNVNIWIVQQKVNLYQHYLNLKYGVGIEMYNFRFEQPISFRNDPNNAVYIDNVKFSKDKLFVEYLSVPIQLNFQSNPSNNRSFYASIGVSPGYLIQSHTKQISEERGKKKVNGNFNLSNFKMATIGELGIGSIRLYGSYNMSNLFDKNYTNLDLMPFAIGVRFSKF